MNSIISEILEDSCKYYESNFLGEYSSPVLYYMRNRGLQDETIKKNRIGFAPQECSYKLFELLNKRFDKKDIEGSHLFIGKWDKFTGYIVIPVIQNKQVIYFTARSFSDKTPIHLHLNGNIKVPYNVDTIGIKNNLIIVESPIDAMILEQEGFSTIASFGVNGFKKIYCDYFKDYKGKIIWLFDSDKNQAGDIGALKSALILQKEGISSYIGKLPFLYGSEKTDINDIYLEDKINFEEKINEIISSSILYETTDHYKKFLLSLEVRKKKRETSEKTRAIIKEIKNLDIVNCLSSILDLEKTTFGAQDFCPFHEDIKSKSLIIYRNTGNIICFGACGFKGDLISFISKYYNLSFTEAIKKIQKDFM